MKKLSSILTILMLFGSMVMSQNLTQTVRGTISDADNNLPLIGATIIVVGSDPVNATITDSNGNFRLEKIPVGRIDLNIS